MNQIVELGDTALLAARKEQTELTNFITRIRFVAEKYPSRSKDPETIILHGLQSFRFAEMLVSTLSHDQDLIDLQASQLEKLQACSILITMLPTDFLCVTQIYAAGSKTNFKIKCIPLRPECASAYMDQYSTVPDNFSGPAGQFDLQWLIDGIVGSESHVLHSFIPTENFRCLSQSSKLSSASSGTYTQFTEYLSILKVSPQATIEVLKILLSILWIAEAEFVQSPIRIYETVQQLVGIDSKTLQTYFSSRIGRNFNESPWSSFVRCILGLLSSKICTFMSKNKGSAHDCARKATFNVVGISKTEYQCNNVTKHLNASYLKCSIETYDDGVDDKAFPHREFGNGYDEALAGKAFLAPQDYDAEIKMIAGSTNKFVAKLVKYMVNYEPVLFLAKSFADKSRVWSIFAYDSQANLQNIKNTLEDSKLAEIAKITDNARICFEFKDFKQLYAHVSIFSQCNLENENEICYAFLKYCRGQELHVSIGSTKMFMSCNTWIHLENMSTSANIDSPKVDFVSSVSSDSLELSSRGETRYNGVRTMNLWQETVEPDEYFVGYNSSLSPVSSEVSRANNVIVVQAPNLPVKTLQKKQKIRRTISGQRCRWLCCTWFYSNDYRFLTWWIPSIFLSCCGKMRTPAIRIAWREKVALCIIIAFLCLLLIFMIAGFGFIVCPRQPFLSQSELNPDTQVYAYGRVFDIQEIVKSHENTYGVPKFTFAPFMGADVSILFYKNLDFANVCPGLEAPQIGWDNIARRPKSDSTFYAHKSGDKPYLGYMNRFAVGKVAWTLSDVSKLSTASKRMIVIGKNVYDVTGYFNSEKQFFGPLVGQMFSNNYGTDATNVWTKIVRQDKLAANYLNCMNAMFYVGTLDTRQDFKCQISNYLLLSTSLFLLAVIGFKFLAALQCTGSSEPEQHDKYVIFQVPCYTEGPESLLRTLESVANSIYDDSKKLLLVIVDGMITGNGNDRPTYRIVLDILGVDPLYDPEPLAFESLGLGDQQLNLSKLHCGMYSCNGHNVPFIVIVKVGKSSETYKPGNRGKRDSQLILMRFLNRVHFNTGFTPMELELFHLMKNVIGIHPKNYEFLLQLDSDTTLLPNASNKMVSAMIHDSKIVGLCGETLIENANVSWTSMIQVYEYFISHHLSKSFESLFGSVTCLPGCFCMYRLRTPVTGIPLLISEQLLREYSINKTETLHLKNLLHLGEDRYLTTLFMKHFPRYKLSFEPEAQCLTTVPDEWAVLVSQRRRWINSTVHNLIELLSVDQLCGVCCFSMRFMVMLDLFATVVQPAGMIYVLYLIYTLSTTTNENFPLISVLIIVAIYGLQIIIFTVKQKWEMIGWMLIYILAMPVFSFYLPLYSFWHFDDFTWGNTQMQGGGDEEKGHGKAVVEFDPDSIIRKTWAESGREVITEKAPSLMSNSFVTYAPALMNAPLVESVRHGKGNNRLKARPKKLTPIQEGQRVINDQEIKCEIRTIIASCVLHKTSRFHVRARLQARFGMNFDDREAEINMWIDEVLNISAT